MFGLNETKSKAWKKLESEYKRFKKVEMRDLFNADDKRGAKYTLKLNDFMLDYSKNRFDEKVLAALLNLAHERHLEENIDKMLLACHSGPPLARVDRVSFVVGRRSGFLPPIIPGVFKRL